MKIPDPNCIAAPLPATARHGCPLEESLWQLDRSEFCAWIIDAMEVRHGNGLDSKSSDCLWISSLNASLAFLLDGWSVLSSVGNRRPTLIFLCAQKEEFSDSMCSPPTSSYPVGRLSRQNCSGCKSSFQYVLNKLWYSPGLR